MIIRKYLRHFLLKDKKIESRSLSKKYNFIKTPYLYSVNLFNTNVGFQRNKIKALGASKPQEKDVLLFSCIRARDQ